MSIKLKIYEAILLGRFFAEITEKP